MKRIVAGILLCALGALYVQASQWGERKESVAARENEKDNAPSRSSASTAKQNANQTTPQTQNVTVLPKILRGEPLKVNIEASWKMTEKGCATAKQRVQNAYNAWFQNAANTIKAQHREQEFIDVLPTLEKGVAIEVNCVTAGAKPAQADVTISLKQNLEGVQEYAEKGTGGSGHSPIGFMRDGRNGKPIEVVVPALPSKDFNPTRVNSVWVHELGHTLGMADTYLDRKDVSRTHRSKEQPPSMMKGTIYLQPDDADGLINIMDSWNIHNAKQKYGSSWKKHISPRVAKGWNSLHRHEKTGSSIDRYQEGTSVAVQVQNKAREISAKANSKVF